MEEIKQINLKDLSIRCRSKKELYDLLVHDCELYLPPVQYANAQYIRNVVTGKAKVVKTKDVRQIQVIQINSTTIDKIISFAKSKFDLENYLPVYKKYRHPDRSWLCNIIYSMVGDEFKVWIQKRMAEREKMILMKRSFNLKVLPELDHAIEVSHRVSPDLKEIIASRDQNENENFELYAEVQDMKEKLKEFKMMQLENLKYRDIIEKYEKEKEEHFATQERIQF